MTDTDATASAPLVLILGLGETGAAAARWCARQGAALRVADTRAEPAGLDALRAALACAQVQYRLGADPLPADLLEGVSQVVVSPGLALDQPPAGALVAAARERGIEVVGEIELFARALAQLSAERGYAPSVLAVTGTNGKTTVTALTRHLVQACGLAVRSAGNIGPAALAALIEALEQDALPQVWVLELSSFQLATTASLSLDAAAVLNLSQDHLDWHGDMAAYAAAKARILEHARVRVLNRDDPQVAGMVATLADRSVRSFGREAPARVGDMGLDHSHGVAWLASGEPTDFDEPAPAAPPRRRKDKDAPAPARAEARMVRMMPVDALRIRGLHNALNAQAALLLARSLELPWGALLRAVREYEGEPHRMEFVRAVAGVDFIDDSKGTNVGATAAGLEGLGRKAVLIAGGLGKGQDFGPLVGPVASHARAVVLIGQDGELIGRALAPAGVPSVAAASLEEAVRQAHALAQPGDAVLLSPACASMDMFRNYVHRGQAFAAAVQELALERGEVA